VLAVARQHLGSQDMVSRVVRLGVYVATASKQVDLVKVADGASEVLRDIFGEHRCRPVWCSVWRAFRSARRLSSKQSLKCRLNAWISQ
jgi:hypothetical protein